MIRNPCIGDAVRVLATGESSFMLGKWLGKVGRISEFDEKEQLAGLIFLKGDGSCYHASNQRRVFWFFYDELEPVDMLAEQEQRAMAELEQEDLDGQLEAHNLLAEFEFPEPKED